MSLPDVVVPREVTEPIATEAVGILQQCGSVAGYDFSGWSVVTSMAAAQGVRIHRNAEGPQASTVR